MSDFKADMRLLFISCRQMTRDCFQASPARVWLLFVLNTLNSLSSGIGILLIIPLIHSTGIQLSTLKNPSEADASNWISAVFEKLGLSTDLTSILLIYLLLIFTISALGYLSTVMTTKLRVQFVDGLRNRIFSSLLYAQWPFLSHEKLSGFARMVTGQVQSIGYTLQQLLGLASRLVLILIYLAISLLLSAKLTLIAVLLGLFLIILMLPLNKHIHQSGQIELKAYTRIFHSALEQLANIKIIKSYSAEQQYLQHMQKAGKRLEAQQIKLAGYSAFSRMFNLCSGALIFAVLFYISVEIIGLPTANLIVILLIFARLMPQLSAVQNQVQQLVHSTPEYVDLVQKLNSLEKYSEPPESHTFKAPSFEHSMVLRNIEFSYPNQTRNVFSGLNLDLRKNQTLAICGASGAGKSTLADIIAGLTAPGKGQILVDGTEINDSNRMAWRSKVAYVTQDVFLFNTSIRENLCWVSAENPTDETLWHCLKMAAADEYVRALPGGLDTEIGDQGMRLSGGEKQRLALARALLTQPEILILDEATSAIDTENSENIREAIDALTGGITLIVIAHDQNSIRHISNRIEL